MSGSPKYSQARLRAVEEQRLRREREQRAREEAARRAAEEERRRKERLASAKARLGKATDVLGSRLQKFARSEAAEIVRDEIDDLMKRLRKAKQAGQSTGSEKAVVKAQREVIALAANLEQLAARAESQLFVDHLAREEAAVESLKRRASALNEQLSQKFDISGLNAVRSALGDAEDALRNRDLSRASQLASEISKVIENHRHKVEKSLAAWTDERDQALAAVAEADDRIAGLEADEVVMRWCKADVERLRAQVQFSSDRIATEDFSGARHAVSEALAQAEQIIRGAQEIQLKEDRRQYIADSIADVMVNMGFIVQAGYPALDDPGTPESDLIIHAVRLGGGAVAVAVPQEGDVWYDVDGFPKEVEIGTAGQEIHSCDEAEQTISAMHAALDEAFGVQMGELMWDGKDPNRIAKKADILPGSTDAFHHMGERM
jgi:hypothetical protein